MAQTDFAMLRNLAFYNGHSNTYFYFKSLDTFRYKIDQNMSELERRGKEQYNQKAEQVAQAGRAILSSSPSFAQDDTTLVAAQLNKLINFVSNAVDTEKNNEIAYFQNKINTFKHTEGLKDEEVIKELQQYLTPDTFQYDKVITLINVLLQGTENTEAIVKHEIQHINEIDNAMKNLKTARMSQLIGLWQSSKSTGIKQKYEGDVTAYLSAAKQRLDRNILVDYTTHGNLYSNIGTTKRKFLPGAKKWLSSLKSTVDVTIGHWITDAIHQILESPTAYAQFLKALQKNYNFNTEDQAAAESAIKSFLIKTATTYATQNISKILNNAYTALNTDELADMIASSIDTVGELNIEGLYDNFGMFGRTVELFKDATTATDLETKEAEGLYDAYLSFRNELKELKQHKQKMSMAQQFLKKAMKTGTDEDKYTSIYTLINRLETLQKRIKNHSKDSQTQYEEWLKQQEFTVSNKTVGKTVTIKIKLKDGQIDMDDLNMQLQHTRALKNLGGRKSRAQSLEGLIRGLKTRTSFSIKQDIINAITPLTTLATKKGLGGEQFIIEAIKTAIENKKISIGGPTFSEIKQGIQESLRSGNSLNDWVGKLNKKNDFVIVVSVDDTPPDLTKALEQIIDHDAEVIAEGIAARLKEATDSYISGFAMDFQAKLQSNQSDEESFNSYKANADAFFEAARKRDTIYKDIDDLSTEIGQAWDEYAAMMQEAGADAKELNKKRQAVIENFKNSFFESSTMKTYNQYQNNLGFVGGSLGANLLQQLDNINELFTAAGMPITPSDMNWLYSAIINCSPNSLVGEKYKNIIEDYLGAMAAFALFDEGGAEAEIISGIADKLRQGYSSPKILHLYAVNSIYVPGSYVLSKVLEELRACADNAYRAYESQKRGATISIINPMNEGMVPNRTNYIHYNSGQKFNIESPADTDPWGTVGNTASHVVQLKILFLAGLLDIAHGINTTLSTIQLPK